MGSSLRWPEPPPAVRRWLPEPEGPIAPPASASKLHDDRIAARLGITLAVTFSICFSTGLWSHVQQDPQSWLAIPARPAGLYRLTQGLHVITGLASVPLLLAKLWAVWPRFVQWPVFRTVRDALWRLALLPLVGGSLFLLGTGTANIAGWYPWKFDFRKAHFAASWLTMGGLLIHVAAVAGISAAALRRSLKEDDATDGRLSRRGFLGVVAAASGAVTVATAGATVRPLRALSVLATRDPGSGPQGLPVNRSALDAGTSDVDLSAFRLQVQGKVATPLELTYDQVLAMATYTATLPITCVEGWSASAAWRGVPVRELLRMAGAEPGAEVMLSSLEQRGTYRTSRLGQDHSADPDTLLATHLDGQPLDPDHGFPLRLVAPNPSRGPADQVGHHGGGHMRIGTVLRVVAGVILFGVAARYVIVRRVDIRPAVWVPWWVTAAVVHDVVVAPLAIGVGWLVVRYVPRFMKAPVQAALLLSAVLVAVSWPALRGYGRVASNPTYLPRSYGTGLLLCLATVWVCCGAWAFARLARDRSATGGSTSLP